MRRSYVRIVAPVITLAILSVSCSDDDESGDGTAAPGGSTVAGQTSEPDSTAGGTTAAPGSTPATGDEVQGGESALDRVKAADTVKCGVRDDLPGFSVADESGDHVGFDADFCRVIAAAVLGDSTKVAFVDVDTDARFTALQAGEFDVLVRNTTWTASRDGIEGATFLHPTFYDGQAMMVASDSGFASIDDMNDTVVCVAGGTTSEGNVAAEFERRGLTLEVQSFDDVDLLQEAFVAGRCDGWSSDLSQLKGLRSAYPDGPEALTIFDEEIFSKEPLTPAVVDGDSQWAQAVEWAIFATIQAEEFEVTSANVDDMLAGDDPRITSFLGGENAEGTAVDAGLGLPADFAYQVVKQVGNYGELFEEHLAPLDIERGLNALWNAEEPGLQYAPPYR